jgi:hypothetical protein
MPASRTVGSLLLRTAWIHCSTKRASLTVLRKSDEQT